MWLTPTNNQCCLRRVRFCSTAARVTYFWWMTRSVTTLNLTHKMEKKYPAKTNSRKRNSSSCWNDLPSPFFSGRKKNTFTLAAFWGIFISNFSGLWNKLEPEKKERFRSKEKKIPRMQQLTLNEVRLSFVDVLCLHVPDPSLKCLNLPDSQNWVEAL